MTDFVAHICCGQVVTDGKCEVCGNRNAGEYKRVAIIPKPPYPDLDWWTDEGLAATLDYLRARAETAESQLASLKEGIDKLAGDWEKRADEREWTIEDGYGYQAALRDLASELLALSDTAEVPERDRIQDAADALREGTRRQRTWTRSTPPTAMRATELPYVKPPPNSEPPYLPRGKHSE